jgi:hypothetical protein
LERRRHFEAHRSTAASAGQGHLIRQKSRHREPQYRWLGRIR